MKSFEEQARANPNLLILVFKAGWSFSNYWWTRCRREGDLDITHRPSVGFTDAERVYVRSAEHAALYDKGLLKDIQC